MSEQKTILVKRERPQFLIEIGIAFAGSCFLAFLSQVAIPCFTPIPITLQTFAVFLLGGILGGRRAACSVLAYLVQGCCGMPVFAGGLSNPLWMTGLQAGFLLSFIPAAFLIGKMVERKAQAGFFYLLATLAIGQLVIFGIGVPWLAVFVGWKKAVMFGIVPFLMGAALKIIAGAIGLRSYTRFLGIFEP